MKLSGDNGPAILQQINNIYRLTSVEKGTDIISLENILIATIITHTSLKEFDISKLDSAPIGSARK